MVNLNQNQNDAPNQNWRSSSKPSAQGSRSQNQNLNRSKQAAKNRPFGPNQTKKKKKPQNRTPNAGPPQAEEVTKEEKQQLGQTLDAIMKRLSAMESRQPLYPHQGVQLHPPVQPLMSPAVPLSNKGR